MYTERDSIFESQNKGRSDPDGQTPFGRALQELGMELILARSPQAKGRVEPFFETAHDRWVKELRLAKVASRDQANALLDRRLVPEFNRRFTVAAARTVDAHRPLGPGHNLAAILGVQYQRVVQNDYSVRFQNRIYRVGKPIYPGLRGGRVVSELRLDGTMAVRFRDRYLNYGEVVAGSCAGGPAPRPPELNALAADAREEEAGRTAETRVRPAGVQPTVGRSGRTPTPPTILHLPPRGGQLKRAAVHPVDHTHFFDADLDTLHQCG
ncbi:MAG TPA: hypothetical protein VH592_08050, partial [Gemmataceae bacterium]